MKVPNLKFQGPFSDVLKSIFYFKFFLFTKCDATIWSYTEIRPLRLMTINSDLIESDVFVITLIIERQRMPAHIATSG